LSAITVDALNSFYASLDGVFFNKSQTTLIQFPEGKTGSYAVPDTVTTIADYAFAFCISLASVTIPNSVTSIGIAAFYYCNSLTSITIPNSLTSIASVAFNHCISLTNVTIPNSVTSIGAGTFQSSHSLISITIPSSVSYVGDIAFSYSPSLTGVYFQGNAPSLGSSLFIFDNNATVYYLPGTTGWGPTFGGRPAVLWNPQVQTSDASFGVRTNQFGFAITGTSNLVIVVEATTNLANPLWSPIGTNALTGGSFYFSDPQWTNYPGRFYRLRSY
jgi:hypothetical protein